MHSLFLFTYITYICAIFKFNLINIKFPCKQDQLLLMQRQMSSPSVVDPSMMVHYQQQQPQFPRAAILPVSSQVKPNYTGLKIIYYVVKSMTKNVGKFYLINKIPM